MLVLCTMISLPHIVSYGLVRLAVGTTFLLNVRFTEGVTSEWNILNVTCSHAYFHTFTAHYSAVLHTDVTWVD